MQPGRCAVATSITFFFSSSSYVIGLPYARSLRGWTQGPLSHPQLRGIYLVTRQQDYQGTTPAVRRDKAWLEIKATPWWSKNEEETGGVRPGFPLSHRRSSQAVGPQFSLWWTLHSLSFLLPQSSLEGDKKNRKSTVDRGVTCNIPKRQKKPGTKQITYPYLLNLYGRIHTD